MKLNLQGDLGIIGTEEGKVHVWDLKKTTQLDSFFFDKESVPEKRKLNEKIRSINFTVDERYVVINNKTQIAYYTTQYLREIKSSSAYKDLEIEIQNQEGKKSSVLDETCTTQPHNFFKDSGFNLLTNIATTENKIAVVQVVKDLLACIRDLN